MSKLLHNKFIIPIVIFLTFLVIGVATVTGYGINWDTINHLPRGQAYLHYFLTGKTDYSDLPKFQSYFQNPAIFSPSTNQTRSYYQTNAADFTWFMQNDGAGHPPLSDIFSSVFNRVLFGKLHIVNDIDSYHVYGIFLSAILVALLYYWIGSLYGKVAGIFSSLFLGLYPLFFSEMHFNTEKDVPETVFWSFFIFSFWKGITTKKIKWILLSGVFFGLALGTKFNILFASLVIVPWLVVYLIQKNKNFKIKELFKLGTTSVIAILGGVFIFIATWPYLWADPITRIGQVVGFYKTIGLTTSVDPRFIGPFSFNTYPIKWISYTTQPVLLFLFGFGILYSIYLLLKKKDLSQVIFLLWFIVPVIRVSYPGTTIYGGIRQIMEYIPAMAIIAGIGGGFLVSKIKNRWLSFVFVFLIFISVLIPIWKSHPNENTYFNFLIGGMSGAVKENIPAWGNSFGSGYRQGINWINNNAPQNSTVVLAYELTPNIPLIWLRKDLVLDNRQRSGLLKGGEYAITLTYQGTSDRSYYDDYLETVLNPVYEVKVDGAGIVKVWKNDIEHTKTQYLKEVEDKNVKVSINKEGLIIDLGQVGLLSRVEAKFNLNKNCSNLSYAYPEISTNGTDWKRLAGVMPKEDWNTSAFGEQPTGNSFIEPFGGDRASQIKYVVSPEDACIKNITSLKVFVFDNKN